MFVKIKFGAYISSPNRYPLPFLADIFIYYIIHIHHYYYYYIVTSLLPVHKIVCCILLQLSGYNHSSASTLPYDVQRSVNFLNISEVVSFTVVTIH